MLKALAGFIVGYWAGEQAVKRGASQAVPPQSGASGWIGAFLILIAILALDTSSSGHLRRDSKASEPPLGRQRSTVRTVKGFAPNAGSRISTISIHLRARAIMRSSPSQHKCNIPQRAAPAAVSAPALAHGAPSAARSPFSFVHNQS
jgi:hypothetical protein